MKKYGIVVSMIVFALALKGQSTISESQRLGIQTSPDDSSKVKLLINASVLLPYNNSDLALFYADSIIRFSEKIDFPFGISYGYAIKTAAYTNQGDLARALYFNNLNRGLLEELHDQLRIAYWHAERANIFSELGDHGEALLQSSIARQLVYSLGDSAYDRRIDEYISIRERKSSRDFEHAKLLLAANMLDSALVYAQRAVEMSKETDWFDWSAFPVLLGDIYAARGDYQAALLSYNRKTAVNFALDSGKNFVGKAAVFVKIDQQDSSSIYARKALDIFQRIHYSKGVLQASELLSRTNEKTNPQEAIMYYKMSMAIRDSLYSKEKVSQLNSIFFNDELRKLDALAAETAAMNKFRMWSLLGISFTLLIAGLLLWRNTHHRKVANIQLQKEKHTVEETLEKIKDYPIPTHPIRKNGESGRTHCRHRP
jgi:two-component system, NtrC family, sensor kinase